MQRNLLVECQAYELDIYSFIAYKLELKDKLKQNIHEITNDYFEAKDDIINYIISRFNLEKNAS